jgi:hypothetical protein
VGVEAHNIWVLRTEALLRAVMPRAVAGDLRAIETCRRILQQQARYYGLYDIERDPFARWRTGRTSSRT